MSRQGFIDKRRRCRARLPEFEALRDTARDIKNHTLAHLDLYLEALRGARSRRPAATCIGPRTRRGGARRSSSSICRGAGAKTVTKGKSMISEEIGLNDRLEAARHHAGRDRSRRIHHPAARRDAEPHHRAGGPSQRGRRSRAISAASHTHLDPARDLSEPVQLLTEARAVLREQLPRRRCRHHRRELPRSPRPAPRSSSPTRAMAT